MLTLITANFLAILIAAIGAFIVGMIWYHPKIFGTLWGNEQPHRNIQEDFQKNFIRMMLASAFDCLFFSMMALVLLAAYQIEGVLLLALSVTIGIYTNNIDKGGTRRLFQIDGGFLLCQLLVITMILSVMTG